MPLFSFLKKKNPPIHLKLNEVDHWLDNYAESKGLDHHFTIFLAEMRQHAKHALEQLDILESAQLQNKNIPQRAINIMEDHRKNYMKTINTFINNLDIPKEYDQLTAFSESFSESIENLEKRTQKSLYILKEFFEKESMAVAKVIGQMDKSITNLRNIFEKLGKDDLDKAYHALHEYHDVLEKRVHLQAALEEEKQKLKEPKLKLKKIQSRLEELQSSNNFRFIEEAKAELQSLDEEKNKLIQKIKTAASPFSKALKKYANQEKGSILDGYVADFAKALKADAELIIADRLVELEKHLDKLDLKPDQAEKAVKAIKRCSRDWLRKQQEAMQSLEDKVKSIKDRIQKDTTRLLIQEQEKWQSSTQESIKEFERNVEIIENELERLDPRLYVSKLRKALQELYQPLELSEK